MVFRRLKKLSEAKIDSQSLEIDHPQRQKIESWRTETTLTEVYNWLLETKTYSHRAITQQKRVICCWPLAAQTVFLKGTFFAQLKKEFRFFVQNEPINIYVISFFISCFGYLVKEFDFLSKTRYEKEYHIYIDGSILDKKSNCFCQLKKEFDFLSKTR